MNSRVENVQQKADVVAKTKASTMKDFERLQAELERLQKVV